MNSEQIDLFVEESDQEVYVRISGTFGFTQFAPLREKVNRIMDGPGNVGFWTWTELALRTRNI